MEECDSNQQRRSTSPDSVITPDTPTGGNRLPIELPTPISIEYSDTTCTKRKRTDTGKEEDVTPRRLCFKPLHVVSVDLGPTLQPLEDEVQRLVQRHELLEQTQDIKAQSLSAANEKSAQEFHELRTTVEVHTTEIKRIDTTLANHCENYTRKIVELDIKLRDDADSIEKVQRAVQAETTTHESHCTTVNAQFEKIEAQMQKRPTRKTTEKQLMEAKLEISRSTNRLEEDLGVMRTRASEIESAQDALQKAIGKCSDMHDQLLKNSESEQTAIRNSLQTTCNKYDERLEGMSQRIAPLPQQIETLEDSYKERDREFQKLTVTTGMQQKNVKDIQSRVQAIEDELISPLTTKTPKSPEGQQEAQPRLRLLEVLRSDNEKHKQHIMETYRGMKCYETRLNNHGEKLRNLESICERQQAELTRKGRELTSMEENRKESEKEMEQKLADAEKRFTMVLYRLDERHQAELNAVRGDIDEELRSVRKTSQKNHDDLIQNNGKLWDYATTSRNLADASLSKLERLRNEDVLSITEVQSAVATVQSRVAAYKEGHEEDLSNLRENTEYRFETSLTVVAESERRLLREVEDFKKMNHLDKANSPARYTQCNESADLVTQFGQPSPPVSTDNHHLHPYTEKPSLQTRIEAIESAQNTFQSEKGSAIATVTENLGTLRDDVAALSQKLEASSQQSPVESPLSPLSASDHIDALYTLFRNLSKRVDALVASETSSKEKVDTLQWEVDTCRMRVETHGARLGQLDQTIKRRGMNSGKERSVIEILD